MFSEDEKEVALAQGKERDLLVRAERWITGAPHRKGCGAIGVRKAALAESLCSCGRTAVLDAFVDARRNGRLP